MFLNGVVNVAGESNFKHRTPGSQPLTSETDSTWFLPELFVPSDEFVYFSKALNLFRKNRLNWPFCRWWIPVVVNYKGMMWGWTVATEGWYTLRVPQAAKTWRIKVQLTKRSNHIKNTVDIPILRISNRMKILCCFFLNSQWRIQRWGRKKIESVIEEHSENMSNIWSTSL